MTLEGCNRVLFRKFVQGYNFGSASSFGLSEDQKAERATRQKERIKQRREELEQKRQAREQERIEIQRRRAEVRKERRRLDDLRADHKAAVKLAKSQGLPPPPPPDLTPRAGNAIRRMAAPPPSMVNQARAPKRSAPAAPKPSAPPSWAAPHANQPTTHVGNPTFDPRVQTSRSSTGSVNMEGYLDVTSTPDVDLAPTPPVRNSLDVPSFKPSRGSIGSTSSMGRDSTMGKTGTIGSTATLGSNGRSPRTARKNATPENTCTWSSNSGRKCNGARVHYSSYCKNHLCPECQSNGKASKEERCEECSIYSGFED